MLECAFEESVGYPIDFSSALPRELPFPLSQVSEVLDSDHCIIFLGEFCDCFSQLPSVRANVVSLLTAELFQSQSCIASMSCSVSVFLEFGAAVLEANLLKRNVSSKVELPQNPAPSTHHGYSNAIGVLVDPENVLGCAWSWGLLLKQSEETVATGNQYACDFPTISQMLVYSTICSVLTYGQPKPFIVSSDGEYGMSSFC